MVHARVPHTRPNARFLTAKVPLAMGGTVLPSQVQDAGAPVTRGALSGAGIALQPGVATDERAARRHRDREQRQGDDKLPLGIPVAVGKHTKHRDSTRDGRKTTASARS